MSSGVQLIKNLVYIRFYFQVWKKYKNPHLLTISENSNSFQNNHILAESQQVY